MMIVKSKELKKIGDRIVRTDPLFELLKLAGARIAYLSSDLEKRKDNKLVFADCRKVSDQYKWCCNYDFMITVYEPNILDFDDEQIEILLTHELLHCGVNTEGNDLGYYLVPHDVEEFNEIIERYGMDWSRREKDA